MTGTSVLFISGALYLAIFAFLWFAAVSIYRANKMAPFYIAQKESVRFTLGLAGLKKGEKLFDLGAGIGNVISLAEKEFGADATGFEISLVPYLLGRLRLFARDNKARLLWQDFFTADLTDADVIYFFGMPNTMPKLKEKFERELRPGTRVVAYTFPLGFWVPTRILELPNKRKSFLYVAE
ncbi:MAG: class I SAM-dependent methyltransferase [Candidatus Liptonbacteria bacterium]|nr:class I SAM-dependent methyltransferase [Candidatus Liptonbacteria bacterium]